MKYSDSMSVSIQALIWNVMLLFVVMVIICPGLMFPLLSGISKVSLPDKPKLSAFWLLRNSQGSIPIPTRFDLWILSKDSAIMALTPYKNGPFAAQSLEDPLPYSLPAKIIIPLSSF